MICPAFIDIPPRPVGDGSIVAVAVIVVTGLLILLSGALVLFLWLRKRRMSTIEMIRPDESPAPAPAQANHPNHP